MNLDLRPHYTSFNEGCDTVGCIFVVVERGNVCIYQERCTDVFHEARKDTLRSEVKLINQNKYEAGLSYIFSRRIICDRVQYCLQSSHLLVHQPGSAGNIVMR